jgi:hypothetical protein
MYKLLLTTLFLTACGEKGEPGLTGMDGADGADGADGNDGNDALVNLEEEPPGDNCENGGTAVSYGTDNNGDGILDSDEVDGTTYICNGADAEDSSSQLRTFFVTDDTLYFQDEEMMSIFCEQYNAIASTYGYIKVGIRNVESLENLSCLTTIYGSLNIFNTAITDMTGLEGLTSIQYELNIFGNDLLTSFNGLDNLLSVGSLRVEGNSSLENLEGLSTLSTVTGVRKPGEGEGDGDTGAETSEDFDIEIKDNPILCQSLVDTFISSFSNLLTDSSNNDDGC